MTYTSHEACSTSLLHIQLGMQWGMCHPSDDTILRLYELRLSYAKVIVELTLLSSMSFLVVNFFRWAIRSCQRCLKPCRSACCLPTYPLSCRSTFWPQWTTPVSSGCYQVLWIAPLWFIFLLCFYALLYYKIDAKAEYLCTCPQLIRWNIAIVNFKLYGQAPLSFCVIWTHLNSDCRKTT